MAEVSLAEWNRFLKDFPEAHLLQTGEWGELKSAFGWDATRLLAQGAGAQILFKRLPFGMTFGYLPKGPITAGTRPSAGGDLWGEIDWICRQRRAVFLKVEPEAWEADQSQHPLEPERPRAASSGFRQSTHSIQPRRTIVVNLRGSEEEILSRMKPKCRYNIRLAAKKGVIVQPWEDVPGFHKMMLITGDRDAFAVHSIEYMQRAYDLFRPGGTAELLVAMYAGRPLAALMVFARGQRAWYLYGASTDDERERMPNYLLQWEAMRWARARGCEEYDLWGVPDEDESVLEANFEKRSDGLWGVYRFKRGFGGELRRTPQTLDRVYQSMFYNLYRWRVARQSAL